MILEGRDRDSPGTASAAPAAPIGMTKLEQAGAVRPRFDQIADETRRAVGVPPTWPCAPARYSSRLQQIDNSFQASVHVADTSMLVSARR
jgi:hypothetical protein